MYDSHARYGLAKSAVHKRTSVMPLPLLVLAPVRPMPAVTAVILSLINSVAIRRDAEIAAIRLRQSFRAKIARDAGPLCPNQRTLNRSKEVSHRHIRQRQIATVSH